MGSSTCMLFLQPPAVANFQQLAALHKAASGCSGQCVGQPSTVYLHAVALALGFAPAPLLPSALQQQLASSRAHCTSQNHTTPMPHT